MTRSYLSRLTPNTSALLLAALLPLLLVLPISTGILDRFDYPAHRELAWSLSWPPHFLYHLMLTLFRAVFGDWMLAQRLLLLVNYAALGVASYIFLSAAKPARAGPLGLAALAASLVFVYSVPALQPVDGHFYKGYAALNVYHNSTSLILKPVLVLHLLWLGIWLKEPAPRRSHALFLTLGGALVMLSALAKPSYVVVLLPALFLLVMRDRSTWRSAMAAVFLPGVAILTWLFVRTFGGGGLELAPLKVLTHFTAAWTILPKAVLSLLFPLSMLLLFRRQVVQDRLSLLCWLMVLFGFAYGVLLAERGERVFDGNWLWSGQLAAFALFATTLRLLLTMRVAAPAWRVRVAWGLYLCHLSAGLVWYLVQFQNQPTLYW